MLIVAYDIHNDKLRTKFWKLLKKFWRRLQYSVFEVKNSERILWIFPVSDSLNKKVLRFWQPALEEEELLFL